MSQGKGLAFDHGQERNQNFSIKSSVYIPERSPNRTQAHSGHQHANNAPSIGDRSYGGTNGDRNGVVCFPIYNDNIDEYAEYLEDFEEPSFYDPPPNSSFDGLMCVMVTPPAAPQQPASAETENVAGAIDIDDLRRRIAAHIETSGDRERFSVQVDDVRKRIAAAIAQSPPKIPPLPEDLYDIPPPPKNTKDVVATIRRARAIARLRALEEEKAPKKPGKNVKRGVRGAPAQKLSLKQVPSLPKPKSAVAKTGVTKKKTQPSKKQLPPDYVSDDWAAAILRTRKLAGLRTTNPKLLRKQEKHQVPTAKSPLPQRPIPSAPPKSPTLENIKQRLAAIRSRTSAAQTALAREEHSILTPTPQDELEEFEHLEELYGGTQPVEHSSLQQSHTDLQNRIDALKQLLQISPTTEHVSKKGDELEDPVQDELDEVEALEEDLQQHASEQQDVAAIQPKPKYDDAFLENIEIPEFDIDDVPEFAFSVEALKDAGFEVGDISLGEISMPDFDEDISFDEPGVDDISAPELDDLPISDDDLAIEADYPLETSRKVNEQPAVAEKISREDMSEDTGFLTSIVNTVIETLKNMFSSSGDVRNIVEDSEENLDTSLTIMFESTPPTQPKPSPIQRPPEKPTTSKEPIVIPPHPKDPRNYKAIVERARAIQKKKAEEAAIAAASTPRTALIRTDKKEKAKIRSTIPKKTPLPKKKIPVQKKVYAPGEYSPSDVKAVAKARSLAGLRNLSDLLNPERAARIAEQKALKEAEEAAIEALPPIERMREKMRRMRRSMGGLPRPSIEALATLEAIRASLPKPNLLKRKWRPAARLRVDRRVPRSERLFSRDFGRILIPTEKTQKKLGWRPIDVMSPITEETQDEAFIQFSPLRPHEGRMRLRALREQAARRNAEVIRDAEVSSRQTSPTHSPITPQVSPHRFSPIQIQSPTSPRTEEIRREKIIRKVGRHGGPETVREEVTQISTIENGEIQTSTRQVTTKTDEYGNVTRKVQEGKGFTGEREAMGEDLADTEPPDFLDTSDIPAPIDPSIPTPAEIINRIQSNVQQRLSLALPNIPQSPRSHSTPSPGQIDLPQDLTDEELVEIEAPEFEKTPQKESPMFSPIERDQRMYAWGEVPPATPSLQTQTPEVPPTTDPPKQITPSPKSKSPEGVIRIPPHPKDPRDYKAMIKRAQAIQKFKQQRDSSSKTVVPKQVPIKSGRVPISRWVEPPARDPRRHPRKRLVLKKRDAKISQKKIGDRMVTADENEELASEPPPLSEEYRRAVARARLIHGLENRTAALNPAVAAQVAAEQAAQAAFDALPEVEKIKRRMEKLRERPAKKHRLEPSADIIGTLEAIRANMPPLEDVLKQPSPTRREPPLSSETISPKTPITGYQTENIPQAPVRAHSRPTAPISLGDASLEEFELMEEYLGAISAIPEVQSTLEELQNIEDELKSDISLEEFEALEAEAQNLYDYNTPIRRERHKPRQILTPPTRPPLHSEALTSDVDPTSTYYGLMEDFRIPVENVLETSQLMFETPPRDIQERLERLRDAQSASIYQEPSYETPAATSLYFTPFRLTSPSSAAEDEHQSSSVSLHEENELLINIEETHEREIHAVKPLRDLEDIPFYEIEYEDEPSLAEISYEEYLSPPPRSSDIIKRIRTTHHQQLLESSRVTASKSPETLKLPEELPDEELFDLTAPSFTQTPKTPPLTHKSPRVSLPLVFGEERFVTPVEPAPSQPTTITEAAPKRQIVIPPHPRDPKDYTTMIKRARAIQKFIREREAEEAAKAPPPAPSKLDKKGRVPISRWQGPPPKKISGKPRRKLVLRKRTGTTLSAEDKKSDIKQSTVREDEREYDELPPLTQEYRDAVARARLLRGLQNRTAALNPRVAAKIAAKKAREEAEAAAFNALPEIEKIKVRMERLRKKPLRQRGTAPTMEQIAYLEALKQIRDYQISSPEVSPLQPPLSLTPREDFKNVSVAESIKLAEFEALEAEVEQDSAVELEAEVQHPAQAVPSLDISELIADMRQQLVTPPRLDPKERYRQLIEQRRTPTIPIASPVKSPEIRYSPITLQPTPSRAEKSTSQITRHGNSIIKERVTETSEMIDGQLQHTKHLATTTTDNQGNVTSQIKESKRVSARDLSAELEYGEHLGDIEEPSFLDTTPSTPLERPRPRDIIDRVGRQLKERYRPEVPTGHLIELRTPPPMLPLPTEMPEEQLLNISDLPFVSTPSQSPIRSPIRSPMRPIDISIPQIFVPTPPARTPPLPPVSPLRYRIPSPEGPIVIPDHPRDPTDYKAMVRRARKIQQLIEQHEAEALAARAEAIKPKKKERVPISRWTAAPPRRPGKRRKLVLRKRGEVMATQAKLDEQVEYPEEPSALPEHFVREVALARKMAGLQNRTAALNPQVAAMHAANAEAIRKVNEAAAVSSRSPIKDYAEVVSRVKELKARGTVVRHQPSLASAAYLYALRGAAQVRHQTVDESPKARYKRIMEARTAVPPAVIESPIVIPPSEEIYSPIPFVIPSADGDEVYLPQSLQPYEFDIADFQNLDELEELSEFQQPSLLDFSQHSIDADQYMPQSPPATPPAPAALISRIRQQYEQEKAVHLPQRSTPPETLEFPQNLPEEELFELSAPSFVQSPIVVEMPTASPNISIPYYFEESPVPRSPTAAATIDDINVASPPLLGVVPGIKVQTPQGPVRIPPHPKDPTDVAAMIRRSQLIHKLQARENAEKAAANKVRVPISRRIPKKSVPRKGKLIRPPTEAPKLPKEYLAQVARARRLAGLKPRTASTTTTTQADMAPPQTNYETLLDRYIALRAEKQKMQQASTARELTRRQRLINRQQRLERRRLQQELDDLQQQQDFEFEPVTPPTARERLQAIKSAIPIEPTAPSAFPYSPVKTPEVIDVSQYQPISLATTPPYRFLENARISDIENISMPFDDIDEYTMMDFDTTEQEDIDFQLAELANMAFMELDEDIDTAEIEGTEQDNFDIAERIRMLQHQLLQSTTTADTDDV